MNAWLSTLYMPLAINMLSLSLFKVLLILKPITPQLVYLLGVLKHALISGQLMIILLNHMI